MARTRHEPAAPSPIWERIGFAVLAVVMAMYFARPINLATADLGRHIANGELVLNGVSDVLFTNHYSFTEPQHPFVNHHWGSGVVYHVVHNLGGFEALTLVNMLCIVGAVGLMFLALAGQVRPWLLVLGFLISAPLIASRTEVRPESFSYLFLTAQIFFLQRLVNGRMGRWMAVTGIALIQLIWVNAHIFFVMGIGATVAFIIAQLLAKKEENVKVLAMILGIQIGVSVINPFHIHGLLAPFSIFTAYGYMVLENQSAWFIYDRFGRSDVIHFFVLCALFCFALFRIFRSGQWRQHIAYMLMATAFMLLSIRAIRGFALFGLMAPVVLALASDGMINGLAHGIRNGWDRAGRLLAVGCGVVLLLWTGTYASPMSTYEVEDPARPGRTRRKVMNALGLFDGVSRSAQFFSRAGLHGPIFNNYDIGGFLIYHLHRTEKVFVDNRPEAYSVAFFDSIYGPMQSDEAVWKAMNDRYRFNVIWFYRHDETEHAQPFLIRRTQDPEWVPVFVDDVSIMLVRATPDNAEVINRHALPREMFSARPN